MARYQLLRHNSSIIRFMKTITLTLLLLLATLPGFTEQKELVITFNDGTTQSYALADLPDIRMENDKLSVQAGTTKAEYDLYKVRTFTFGNTATSLKETLRRQELRQEGNQLVIPGKKVDFSIFTLNGHPVSVKASRLSDALIINLEQLPKGLYIIKANGKSIKITKR